jgi:pimeloyl-ACP methyl ester carboxylesterase
MKLEGPQQMPIFERNGSSLHYLVRGSGEPVLLIHGLGSSGCDWALQVPALETRFQTIVPDLPGCGHSTAAQGESSIADFAACLWGLLDHLGHERVNIIGFSLGGAVALEMALQRPQSVPRLALINSLASYLLDDWRKWCEARLPALVISLLGMRAAARLAAMRLFPEPWQDAMRQRARAVIAAVPARTYLDMGLALQRWTAVDRLHRLRSRVLLVAGERDYTPLAEKRAMAVHLRASLVVVRGSRHGTPFDSIQATNSSLVAHLSDQDLPHPDRWTLDTPSHARSLNLAGSIVEDHALGR